MVRGGSKLKLRESLLGEAGAIGVVIVFVDFDGESPFHLNNRNIE